MIQGKVHCWTNIFVAFGWPVDVPASHAFSYRPTVHAGEPNDYFSVTNFSKEQILPRNSYSSRKAYNFYLKNLNPFVEDILQLFYSIAVFCLQNFICLLFIFADQVFIDPTFSGIFVCGPLQSFVVNVCPFLDIFS